jgi:hypothetical protein
MMVSKSPKVYGLGLHIRYNPRFWSVGLADLNSGFSSSKTVKGCRFTRATNGSNFPFITESEGFTITSVVLKGKEKLAIYVLAVNFS